MGWNWDNYNNTVFVFSVDIEELLFTFEEDESPFEIPDGGIFNIVMPYNKFNKEHLAKFVRIVRPYKFDDFYYSKFEPGHKAPDIIMKCWRMLQIDRLLQ